MSDKTREPPNALELIAAQLGDPINPAPDVHGSPSRIESVKEDKGRGWDIGYNGSTHVFLGLDRVSWDRRGWLEENPSRVGDEVTVYFHRGSFVLGMDLRGERLWLQSERETNAEQLLRSARYRREKHETFLRQRDDLDAQYEALPVVFKARIDRRRANNPDFREEFESYELFCCTEAVKLAERAEFAASVGLSDEVQEFWGDEEKLKLAAYPSSESWSDPGDDRLRWLFWTDALNSKAYGYNYKRSVEVTGLSDGHSGNTHGASYSLARLYLVAPERVPDQYGALAPLVGSEAYGDV
jgi:hypothetical protein